MTGSHGTKSVMLRRKLHSRTSKTKEGQAWLVGVTFMRNLLPSMADFVSFDRPCKRAYCCSSITCMPGFHNLFIILNTMWSLNSSTVEIHGCVFVFSKMKQNKNFQKINNYLPQKGRFCQDQKPPEQRLRHKILGWEWDENFMLMQVAPATPSSWNPCHVTKKGRINKWWSERKQLDRKTHSLVCYDNKNINQMKSNEIKWRYDPRTYWTI